MRKYYLLAPLIGLMACNSDTPSDEVTQIEPEEKINKIEVINEALTSGIRHDTIFLDFRFGMSKNQVVSWVKNLSYQKKLYKDQSAYVYDFKLNDAKDIKLKTNFKMNYHKNKLYEMVLKIIPEPKHDSATFVTSFSAFQKLFRKKYGSPDIVEKSEIYPNDLENMMWIDGNLSIYLESYEDKILIAYTNQEVQTYLDNKDQIEVESDI